MHPRFNKEYSDLGPVEKEENRAAARRIPEVLALAGMGIIEDGAVGDADGVDDQLKYHLERLAEAEHNGWMAHRFENGWKFDKERDEDRMCHDALVPYDELSEKNREKDRNSIRRFPDMVKLAKFRIVFLGDA